MGKGRKSGSQAGLNYREAEWPDPPIGEKGSMAYHSQISVTTRATREMKGASSGHQFIRVGDSVLLQSAGKEPPYVAQVCLGSGSAFLVLCVFDCRVGRCHAFARTARLLAGS